MVLRYKPFSGRMVKASQTRLTDLSPRIRTAEGGFPVIQLQRCTFSCVSAKGKHFCTLFVTFLMAKCQLSFCYRASPQTPPTTVLRSMLFTRLTYSRCPQIQSSKWSNLSSRPWISRPYNVSNLATDLQPLNEAMASHPLHGVVKWNLKCWPAP